MRSVFRATTFILVTTACLLLSGCGRESRAAVLRLSQVGHERDLPPAPREFRGLWVASVANIDWPSAPGLSAARQKEELVELLDQAARVRINAIILQVRPMCDALYRSSREPWSPYLTGVMGRDPGYDPLALAIREAHRRGMELHAWFNPFRARHSTARSISPDHVSKRRADVVRRYGDQEWLDPGEPWAREYSLGVIVDVVRRYDVDGVHLDDYFYPYPIRENNQVTAFPDDASWKRYGAASGLSRADWRRSNVDDFVARLYRGVKAEKRWVKVGISPFGIWRPGNPPQVRGLDAYNELFADSRGWLARGWVDYLSPQLYWPIAPPAQSFPVLLAWWAQQNPRGRHIWPGSNASKVGPQGWSAEEIVEQIRVTRAQRGAGGNVLFSAAPLRENRVGLAGALQAVYAAPALVPPSRWLDDAPPPAPEVREMQDARTSERWLQISGTGPAPAWWLVRLRYGDQWRMRVLPGQQGAFDLPRPAADVISVAAVDHAGNLSPPAIIRAARAERAEVDVH